MKYLFVKLRSFYASKGGVAAVEFSLIAPTLILLVFGCITLFMIMDDSNRAENATFTTADILSRQTTVSSNFLKTTYDMFSAMLPASHGNTKFRVSSLKMLEKGLAVDWSYAIAPMSPLGSADIPTQKLPLVSKGDSLIFLETEVSYKPITMLGGFVASSHVNSAANRPRFTSAIVKTD